MEIKDSIKHLRESHGLSQHEFGVIAGVSDKAVSAWEAGTRIPRMGAIEKLAQYFQIQKSDIIDGCVTSDGKNRPYYFDPETAMLAQAAANDPDMRLLLDAKRDLSPEDMKMIIDLAKRLLNRN